MPDEINMSDEGKDPFEEIDDEEDDEIEGAGMHIEGAADEVEEEDDAGFLSPDER